MTAGEQSAFERLALAEDALMLRRADEAGKFDGLVVPGLGEWTATIRALCAT
jgi:predicted HD phosphohydrolase